MTRALIFAAVAAALWTMAPGLADPYQSPKLLAMGLVAIAMLLAPARHESRLEGHVAWALLLWAIAAACTTDRSYMLVGAWLQPFDGYTAVVIYAALAIGAARLGSDLEQTADAVCVAGVPVCYYAILQRFFADPLIPAALPSGRVVATMGSPVLLGPVLAIVAACAMARRNWLALALAIPALYLTGTRGAMLGACAAALVLAPGRLRWLAAAFGAAVVLLHPRAAAVASDVGRMEIWRIAWDVFKSRPIVGVGPGAFGEAFRAHVSPAYVIVRGSSLAAADHAHNELLQALATTGVVGGLGYIVLLGGAAALAAENQLLLAAGAAYLVPAMLNPAPHAAVALLALLFGAASAVARVDRQPRRWALAAAAALSVALTARVVAGDYHYARGLRSTDAMTRADQFNRAAQADPWEPKITAAQLDSAAAVTKDPAVAAACVSIARELVARHPLDSSAHEILGLAMLRAGGSLEDAAAEYDEAQRLAPTFPLLMLRRRALAAFMGQGWRLQAAESDLARVRAWERGGA
jgi:O-antigen ligase